MHTSPSEYYDIYKTCCESKDFRKVNIFNPESNPTKRDYCYHTHFTNDKGEALFK